MQGHYIRTWTDTYKIHSYESDLSAKASIIAILQFMQESAWNHAEHLELGFSQLRAKNLAWVMARLSLQVTALPQWHETVIVDTFPSARDKLFAYRDFRISAEKGDPLAVGTTTWLAIDLSSRRPQRTESYFPLQEWGDYEHAYPGFAPKVDEITTAVSIARREVYFSHLDVNGHVNNVRYLEYILDSFDLNFRTKHQLVKVDMNFLNEAVYGDVVDIRTQQFDAFYLHALFRAGGPELCRIKTTWESADEGFVR